MGTKILNRNLNLDIIRIIAVLAVVMIHCSAAFVVYYEINSFEYLIGNILDSVSRIGVPLFLMISGSLLLDERRNITIKNIIYKNIKNIVILTVFWSIFYSFIYTVVINILSNNPVNIKEFLYVIINGQTHMWYLYMIIGIYLTVPFLRQFVRKSNSNLVLFYIFISLISQFVKPLLSSLSMFYDDLSIINSFINKFHLNFFGGFISYYLTGWYIIHIGINKKWVRNIIYILSAISIITIILYAQFTKDYSNVYYELGLLVYIYSTGLFLFLSNIKLQFNECLSKIVITLSNLTFGVYIIHPLCQRVFTSIFNYNTNPLLYISVYFFTVILVSFIGCYVASKIPIVKFLFRA